MEGFGNVKKIVALLKELFRANTEKPRKYTERNRQKKIITAWVMLVKN